MRPFLYCVCCQTRHTLSTAGSQSGSLPFQISANTVIHRSIFLPILILKRIYSLSSYTWSSFRSSHKSIVPYGTYVLYFHPYTGSHSPTHAFKQPHLHVLRPGAPLRNKVQPTTVMKLLWDFVYMCQRINTGESYIFYFGIFICGAQFYRASTVLCIIFTDFYGLYI